MTINQKEQTENTFKYKKLKYKSVYVVLSPDSNLTPEDGRHRQIHWTIATRNLTTCLLTNLPFRLNAFNLTFFHHDVEDVVVKTVLNN